jgi:hypothetical protein
MEDNRLEGLERRAARVAAVRRRIERWRWTRQGRTRMPRELWAAAVELGRAHGAYRIARALGVNYQTLKDRLEEDPQEQGRRLTAAGAATGCAGDDGAAAASGFVELGTMLLPTTAAHSVVELSDPSGRTLVIRLSRAPDLPALVAAFWR